MLAFVQGEFRRDVYKRQSMRYVLKSWPVCSPSSKEMKFILLFTLKKLDAEGVAKFENILISGNTPYVLEEVDTAIRYVVPASQNAPVEWNKAVSYTHLDVYKRQGIDAMFSTSINYG